MRRSRLSPLQLMQHELPLTVGGPHTPLPVGGSCGWPRSSPCPTMGPVLMLSCIGHGRGVAARRLGAAAVGRDAGGPAGTGLWNQGQKRALCCCLAALRVTGLNCRGAMLLQQTGVC